MRLIVSLFVLALLAAPETALAAERSAAYTAGRIFGYLLIIALVVVVVRWLIRRVAR